VGPLVSIIIASFNKEKFIKETIQSVISQTYENWELIIVDDHSIDNTISIVETFLSDSRIFLTQNALNMGANYCRNFGLKNGKGIYVIFLDADDLLISDCLSLRLQKANENSDSNLLVFTMGVFYRKVGDDQRKWTPISNTPLKDFLRHKLPWSILQPFWKREFLIDLGGFDESFQRLQDVELNTRALLHEKICYKLIQAEPDCYYRIDETRKNFDTYNFLNRWVDSAIQYCDKFKDLVKKADRPYLIGTIYQSELQTIYQMKNNHILKKQFDELFERLNSSSIVIELGLVKKLILRFAKIYNLYLMRIPGLNRLIFYILKS
jgi:glycosyltransferase involved in cell wall biosynthesis